MHEGAVCREIMDIAQNAAASNHIEKIYEIVVATGPYSCVIESQLNFYFDICRVGTCMEEAVIRLEQDDTIEGTSQIFVRSIRGD